MRRPATGATNRPVHARPGMGFGRPLRPQPAKVTRTSFSAQLEAFLRGEIAEPVTTDRSSVTSTDSLA